MADYALPPEDLLAYTLFSETKDYDDAMAIASVILNRLKRPQRFGGTLEEIIYAPKQFSGVGSSEFKKAMGGKLNEEEKRILDVMKQISKVSIMGILSDTTGGADHYFNPKLANPSWAKKMEKTYETGQHTYYKE